MIVFVNFVRTFLFGLFLAAAGGFLTWHSVKMHYAGVVVFMHVLLALFGLLLVVFAIRTADRALRTLSR
jgi:hypothetical protein